MSYRIAIALIAGLLMVGCAMAQFATPPATPEDVYEFVEAGVHHIPAGAVVWANADADVWPLVDTTTYWSDTEAYAKGTAEVLNEPPYVPNSDPWSKSTAETKSLSGFGNIMADWQGGAMAFEHMLTPIEVTENPDGSTTTKYELINVPLSNKKLDNVAIAGTDAMAEATGYESAWTAIATNADTDAWAMRSDADAWVIVGAIAN
jgi:hypothetical protein